MNTGDNEYPFTEISFTVPAGIKRDRADKVLSLHNPEFSRSRWQKLFDSGHIWLDEESIPKKHKVSAGDCLNIYIPPPKPTELLPNPIPLNILYEDDDLVVVNKACGMVVHPGNGTGNDTLVHALLAHCGDSLKDVGGEERPGIVHRLDKETTGVILVAKSSAAFTELSKAFSERRVHKTYLALVEGIPSLNSGSIKKPIGRHKVLRIKMAIDERGRQAHSDWKLVESYKDQYALLKVVIHTGRTHQIRVHLADMHHSIAGDVLYGWRARKDRSPDREMNRVFLHAYEIGINHPVTGEAMTFTAPLPGDFTSILEKLGSGS